MPWTITEYSYKCMIDHAFPYTRTDTHQRMCLFMQTLGVLRPKAIHKQKRLRLS